MGYLFLSVSILSGAIKGFFGKKISDKTSGLKGAVFANFIRMLLCIPVGLLFVFIVDDFSDLHVSKKVLGIAAFAGVATSVFIASWLLAVQKCAFTAVDTFVSMGILIPIVLSGVFYSESVTLSQIIGLVLLFCAVIIMSLYSNQIKKKLSIFSLLLLLVVGLANGINEFSYKIFDYNNGDTPASVFNFYIYVFSAVVLLTIFTLLHIVSLVKAKTAPALTAGTGNALLDKRKTLYIAVMAVFLFCNSYFKTLAANRLPAVQIYPLAQGAALVFALLMAAIFFKEKIKPLCILGLAVLFVGLLFINVIKF